MNHCRIDQPLNPKMKKIYVILWFLIEQESYVTFIWKVPGGNVGVLGPTAHPGLPLKVLFGVGRCYRL
jgi:hypothetical protein